MAIVIQIFGLCLWIYEEEIVEIIAFYRKAYLDFAAQKISNKALWYINLLDYNVGQQVVQKPVRLDSTSVKYFGVGLVVWGHI